MCFLTKEILRLKKLAIDHLLKTCKTLILYSIKGSIWVLPVCVSVLCVINGFNFLTINQILL